MAGILPMAELAAKYAFFKKCGYVPHDKQKLIHNSAARYKLANCGRRFGKTKVNGMEAAALLMQPKKRIWIVGNSYDTAEKEFRVVWEALIDTLKIETTKKFYNKNQGQLSIELPWGSSIECRSTKYPELLVGDSLDMVVLSEAAKQDDQLYERFLRPALADKRGSMLAATTPEGHNWYYQLWLKGQKENEIYESWQFPSWDNTTVFSGGRYDPEILQMEADMLDDAFDQEIRADFSSFVGKIYPEFAEDTHVGSAQFNPELPNYMGMDFGYTNPLAAVEYQIDPDTNIVYVWREHYKKFTTLDDNIEEMQQRSQPAGYHLDMVFGDAADPEGVETVSRKMAPCVADPRSKVNWREGVNLVRGFLKSKRLNEETMVVEATSKMVVDSQCTNLIREFNNYKANNPTKGKNVAECAVNQDDHALDALRYGLMHNIKLGYGDGIKQVYDLNVDPLSLAQKGGGIGVLYEADISAGHFTADSLNF